MFEKNLEYDPKRNTRDHPRSEARAAEAQTTAKAFEDEKDQEGICPRLEKDETLFQLHAKPIQAI